jgi:hypothetical protein
VPWVGSSFTAVVLEVGLAGRRSRGRRMVKVEPLPGVDSSSMRPPWNQTSSALTALVLASRSVLMLTGQESAVRKAAGVGRKVSAKSVKSMLAAADMVIEAYGIYADAMRSAGVLPADVDTLIGMANALAAADKVQEGRVVSGQTPNHFIASSRDRNTSPVTFQLPSMNTCQIRFSPYSSSRDTYIASLAVPNLAPRSVHDTPIAWSPEMVRLSALRGRECGSQSITAYRCAGV